MCHLWRFPEGLSLSKVKRRLPSAGHHRTGRTGSTPWEVRLTAPELPERAALRDILKPADAREAEPAPEGNAGGGAGQDGADRVGDGEVAGGDGGTESERPDVKRNNISYNMGAVALTNENS